VKNLFSVFVFVAVEAIFSFQSEFPVSLSQTVWLIDVNSEAWFTLKPVSTSFPFCIEIEIWKTNLFSWFRRLIKRNRYELYWIFFKTILGEKTENYWCFVILRAQKYNIPCIRVEYGVYRCMFKVWKKRNSRRSSDFISTNNETVVLYYILEKFNVWQKLQNDTHIRLRKKSWVVTKKKLEVTKKSYGF